MQTNQLAHRIVLPALLIALNVTIARVFIIPVPLTHGNINLCDAGIFIAALLYGRRTGAIVGGLSGLLLDLISDYSQYILFSLVVHGFEGLVVGWLGYQAGRKVQLWALLVGGLIVIIGYFFTDTLLYSLTPGLVGIPTNAVQILAGAVIALPLAVKLR
ncbi:ECF transporter S component [Loigolactobacillus binensis]|uniref:ECF transporter S component n=1 Tax=Loigolactobacillus binensis TaxID=2559922 RepID=A0ABW3ECH4_9LACO|nr:ECF transporter S component [Loigolactobacillus binensis]